MDKKMEGDAASKKFRGFTLIELVVVLTILAILGTIGFLSVGGYSSRARDSERVTDIGSLSKTLDVAIITAGNYPPPDNSFSVTYSGGLVWNQGTAGTSVISQLHNFVSGGGLNKKPLDPLKNSEYVYSVLAFGKAYQLKTDYEGDLSPVASNNLISAAYAAPGNPTVAYIRGNYGGLAAKTQSGSTICVLAIPSIVTSTGSVGSNVEITSNTLSGTLLFSGKNLRNASSFNPTTTVYCGSSLPVSDAGGQITSMMNNLKAAYSGSDIATNVSSVSNLLAPTSTGAVLSNLGNTVITGQLGGILNSGSTAPDILAPTITSVTAAQSACNTIRFTVNGATDNYSLASSAYSFDGGISWQSTNYKDFSGTIYALLTTKVKVRDTAGNMYVHIPVVNGTSAACPINCSYTTAQGGCNAGCDWGNYNMYYNKTVVEANGGTCPISQGQYAGLGGSCYAGACCTPNGSYSYGSCSVSSCGQTGTMAQYDSCGDYVGSVSCSTAACCTWGYQTQCTSTYGCCTSASYGSCITNIDNVTLCFNGSVQCSTCGSCSSVYGCY